MKEEPIFFSLILWILASPFLLLFWVITLPFCPKQGDDYWKNRHSMDARTAEEGWWQAVEQVDAECPGWYAALNKED